MTLPISSNAPVAGLLVIAWLAGCGEAPAAPAAPPAAEPAATGPAAAPAEPAAAAEPEPAAAPAEPPPADEACGRMIVVAYQGAKFADAKISRSKQEAEQRAAALLAKVREGGDFAALAGAESDAPTSAARGGVMGTYARQEWPELHGALRDPLFALQVDAVAEAVVEAPYGYVVLGRCPVEKARSRHILVRYAGAKKADDSIERSKAEAKARAQELLAKLEGGADFAELARQESDDSSAERGGDVGSRGRGVLAKAYEDALFALASGKRSGVVESEFGFHIIERLPD